MTARRSESSQTAKGELSDKIAFLMSDSGFCRRWQYFGFFGLSNLWSAIPFGFGKTIGSAFKTAVLVCRKGSVTVNKKEYLFLHAWCNFICPVQPPNICRGSQEFQINHCLIILINNNILNINKIIN